MTTQLANMPRQRLVEIGAVGRNEPNYAWGQAVSSILALPALRAFWPMSSVDYTVASRARDVAGGGYHLADNNTPLFGYDQLAPYVEFDGATQYLSRADGGAANWADVTGTETYVEAKSGGLTMGGWFNLASLQHAGMITKYLSAGTQRSYALKYLPAPTDAFVLLVSGGGGAPAVLISTITPGIINTWYFAVGRFTTAIPEMDIFVNNVVTNLAVAVPASVYDSTAPFEIGRYDASSYFDGRASLCFLCAAALSDSQITALYHQTRKLYNV